jgi:hypothetical protein
VSAQPIALSFSRLSLFAACPLKYRYLEVDRAPEPGVPPDWRRAPRGMGPASVASRLDRSLGIAVHGALARWQRGVDAGGPASPGSLVAAVRTAAAAAGLKGPQLETGLARLNVGLRAYAGGPWPRRGTLFLEQRVAHVIEDAADGFAVGLQLRVDRVARFRRGVAILDFKTVSPHAFELRADRWQLRTYALAAPGLVGLPAERVHLVLVDLQRGAEVEVSTDPEELKAAAAELLALGRRISAGDFELHGANPDRPCWSCGFRLTCRASLAPQPPGRG